MEIEVKIVNGWIARDTSGFTRLYDDEPGVFNDYKWMAWGSSSSMVFEDVIRYIRYVDKLSAICSPGEAVKFVDGEVVEKKYLPGRDV